MQGSNNHKFTGQINKIIKGLNPKKATGPDKTPVKIVKLAANVIDSHLTMFHLMSHALDNNLFTGAVLMDLSKAFDCILHNLLIDTLHAYGLDINTVTFLHDYLKHRKQSVKINNISSFFKTILSRVPYDQY